MLSSILLFLGVPTVGATLLLYGFTRKNRRRLSILALGMLVGLVVVGLGYRTIIAEAQAIAQLAAPYQGALRDLLRKPDAQHWQAFQPVVRAIVPHVGRLWRIALPLVPLVALYLESTRTRNVHEQREERERRERAKEQEQRRQAAQQVKRAPDAAGGLAVIGVPLAGDLDWTRKGWAVYTSQMLNRHAVIIGAARMRRDAPRRRCDSGEMRGGKQGGALGDRERGVPCGQTGLRSRSTRSGVSHSGVFGGESYIDIRSGACRWKSASGCVSRTCDPVKASHIMLSKHQA